MASIAEGNTINPNETAKDMTSAWTKWKAKGEEFANKAKAEKAELKQQVEAEAEKLKQQAEATKADLEQQATEAKELVESKQAKIQEEIVQNQAGINAMGKNVVQGRVKEGMLSWAKKAKSARKNMEKIKEDAGQAGKVMKQEAQRVHGEKVSSIMAGDSMAGILAGTEEESTGGLGANTPMQSSSGAHTVGGRRRRRKSRKKKKKSKRKSRRKKTRKIKSRKSRKKRRKKSKKSRRRRRR